MSRDPIEEEGGINLYVSIQNNALIYVDPLGLYEFKIGMPTINTGRIPLGLFWVQIKIKRKWIVNVEIRKEKSDCPTKMPSDIKPHVSLQGYDEGIGLDLQIGAKGDGFKALVGYKAGFSTSGDNLLEQMWNLSKDSGVYQDVEAEFQKWTRSFQYRQHKTPCACVNAKLSIDVEGQSGVYNVRALVGALVAGAILEPSPAGEAAVASAAASLAVAPPIFEQEN